MRMSKTTISTWKAAPTAIVRPKRWWWPPDRKKAKIVQKFINYQLKDKKLADKIMNRVLVDWLGSKETDK